MLNKIFGVVNAVERRDIVIGAVASTIGIGVGVGGTILAQAIFKKKADKAKAEPIAK